jgi:hypothetical protein
MQLKKFISVKDYLPLDGEQVDVVINFESKCLIKRGYIYIDKQGFQEPTCYYMMIHELCYFLHEGLVTHWCLQ